MAQETSKANSLRRSKETNYINKFFVGKGIDVGAGANPLNYQKIDFRDSAFFSNYRFFKNNSYFPKIDSVKIYSSDWDSNNEAEAILKREGIRKYDFCYSSNLLEHVKNFQRSLLDFSLVTKANGYVISCVPDFLLYEKEIWPSIKNIDHISCFSINRDTNFDTHYNLSKVLSYHTNLQVVKLELADTLYDYSVDDKDIDQTNTEPHGAECFIEFVCKVLPEACYNNYAILSPIELLTLNDFEITQDVLVVQNSLSETEKLRIANLPYTETLIPLADSIQNTFPVFINKNYIAKFKNSLK
jgi:hypothetical protein